ncbi:MAG TPA: penicillin-binding transpeptidase domain-containing protein [Acidimicrobiales bacterium]|nr:penicillin-binding transpeptidase domain-containing protein [Acidimicrobiales bacterium]
MTRGAASLSPRHRRLAVAVAVAVLALGAGAVWWVGRSSTPGPRQAAERLASAWSAGRPHQGPVIDPRHVAETYPRVVEGLDAAPPAVALRSLDEPGGDASVVARFQVTWDLGGGQQLTYPTTAELEQREGAWLVAFTPAVVHPGLDVDGRLMRRRLVPERGDIEAADGTPLVTRRPVVHVGVERARVQDVGALTATLASLLDIDAVRLAERIGAAEPNAFVPVLTLRADAYEALRDRLQPLPGTVFRRDELPLAPSRDFARPVLGTAGEVTAELVEQRPDRYQPGDIAGLSGVQRRFDDHLGGTVGFEVVAVEGDGAEAEVLLRREPTPGRTLRVTLDERVQAAAEASLSTVDHPSALVAIRISDGHVLAAANGPGTGGRDIALGGRFPPGSTFKVVATAALLDGGLDPESTVACPQTATVDGRSFRNAEQGVLGDVSFREAFAQSCNTTFVELATELRDDALQEVSRRFGLGLEDDLGVGAYRGEVPVNDSAVDRAAAAIGQGRNLVSPLALADVAATVARGRHLSPRLVLDPDVTSAGDAVVDPLDPGVATTLQRLMRSVVTDGSGRLLADLAGPAVHGKSGTAEYGNEDPPRTHAWFIAYQGDVALSVLVAETADGFGGRVAAPVAADFLSRL